MFSITDCISDNCYQVLRGDITGYQLTEVESCTQDTHSECRVCVHTVTIGRMTGVQQQESPIMLVDALGVGYSNERFIFE